MDARRLLLTHLGPGTDLDRARATVAEVWASPVGAPADLVTEGGAEPEDAP
ncbi:hypothetical protein ABZ490_23365 [Streptomyces sp. NPDC005811]|uniref:hypothetical protein n=1 Tax=Streptomyces sp. NPDC005811 TaxID=3154565 RepID=UPI0033CA7BB8